MDGVERGNNWHHHCKAAVSDHHVVLQLMAVIAERDAALLEKNTAIAEKMAAWAERDAALLQRDAALADRDSALLKRDAAISALAKVEKESSSCARKRPSSAGGIHGSKLLQRVGFAEHYSLVVSPGVPAQNKALHLAVKKVESWPSPIQRQLQEYQVKGDEEEGQTRESEIASTASYATMPVSAPTRIPYCSCTGMNQQCYRWGSGGWQSACCTTLLSLHPLPMNPKKRGSRVAGRKMSAGAFDKLLEKLKLEGVDVSYSVDLKDHWAKHGTNRYVTLR
ncbi:unnamed protein product [Sphagnum jensenii]|uniref:GAGA-binding transcriptional activator n=1 Tax=Sphagnum jensenii TaxID=128206 RepID=A0ABP1BAA5_9BRYO